MQWYSGTAWEAKDADGKILVLVDVLICHAATATSKSLVNRQPMAVKSPAHARLMNSTVG